MGTCTSFFFLDGSHRGWQRLVVGRHRRRCLAPALDPPRQLGRVRPPAVKFIASTPAVFTACAPVMECTAPAGAPRTCAVAEYTAPVLAEFAAPSTSTSPSAADLGNAVVKYVESTPALSGVPAPAVEGHRCSACRVDLASACGPVSGSPASVVDYMGQRLWSNTSSQRLLSRARRSQRSTASKHRLPYRSRRARARACQNSHL